MTGHLHSYIILILGLLTYSIVFDLFSILFLFFNNSFISLLRRLNANLFSCLYLNISINICNSVQLQIPIQTRRPSERLAGVSEVVWSP